MSDKPYRVSWGYMHENWEDFATFAEAKTKHDELSKVRSNWGPPSIMNTDLAEGGYGDDGQGFHNGLTEEEREELL